MLMIVRMRKWLLLLPLILCKKLFFCNGDCIFLNFQEQLDYATYVVRLRPTGNTRISTSCNYEVYIDSEGYVLRNEISTYIIMEIYKNDNSNNDNNITIGDRIRVLYSTDTGYRLNIPLSITGDDNDNNGFLALLGKVGYCYDDDRTLIDIISRKNDTNIQDIPYALDECNDANIPWLELSDEQLALLSSLSNNNSEEINNNNATTLITTPVPTISNINPTTSSPSSIHNNTVTPTALSSNHTSPTAGPTIMPKEMDNETTTTTTTLAPSMTLLVVPTPPPTNETIILPSTINPTIMKIDYNNETNTTDLNVTTTSTPMSLSTNFPSEITTPTTLPTNTPTNTSTPTPTIKIIEETASTAASGGIVLVFQYSYFSFYIITWLLIPLY